MLLPAVLALGGCIGGESSAELRDAVRDLSGQLVVFPGAQGYGVTTPAGRRGAVIRVTSLAADGPGTLREALSTPGARTVIFEIAGLITVREPLVIAEPFVTVAGQTAPAPGITITGAGLVILTHDVLVQHLRVRVGDALDGPDPGGRDGLSITGAADGSLDVHGVVIDHCSFTWAIDEGASTWHPGVHDVTLRRSIFAENLSHSIHPKGEHSKGLLIGDHSKRVAVVGNLFAHNVMRNPILKGDVSAVVVNNVIYNPGSQAIHLDDPEGSGPTLATIVGNVLKAGPDTNRFMPLVDALGYVKSTSEIYLHDNYSGWPLISRTVFQPWVIKTLEAGYASAPVRVEPLTIHPADEVVDVVLADVGPRQAEADAGDGADARIVADVRRGSGAILDSPSQVGGLPVLPRVLRPLTLPPDPDGDADADG